MPSDLSGVVPGDMPEEDAQPQQSSWRRYLPRMAVSFPKFVAVKNPRMGIFYWLLVVYVCVITMLYFLQNSSTVVVDRHPTIYRDICNPECGLTTSEIDARIALTLQDAPCERPGEFSFRQNSTTYDGISCANRCGSGNVGSSSCFLASELMHMPPDQSEMFFPTFYSETTRVPARSGGGCPAGYASQSSGLCERSGNFFVPGAERSQFRMHHGFDVLPPPDLVFGFGMSSMTQKSMARSSSVTAVGWTTGMKTVVFDSEGVLSKSFDLGEPISLSVLEILEYTRFEVFTGSRLRIDTRYSNPTSGVYPNELAGGENASVRLTGMEVTMYMHYTDKGACYHHPTDKMISIDHKPVCCIILEAERTFSRRFDEHPLGAGGGSRKRSYHGVRVTFSKSGAIGYLDMTKLTENITVFIVWIQLPLVALYWICIFLLGKLSDVYSHVIHMRFNLPDACIGLAARLLSHSAAFMDMRGSPAGISRDRLHDRCNQIIGNHHLIDEAELERFTDFLLEGIKDLAETEKDREAFEIKINEYCSACISDEPLSISQLADLFDVDRTVGKLERLFQDKVINKLIDDQKTDREDAISTAESRRQNHSQREVAFEELTAINAQVSELDSATSATLDECAEMLGVEFLASEGAGLRRDVPKDDQNESHCSIADEDDAGKEIR